MNRSAAALLAAAALASSVARADLPSIRFDQIQPLGASAGSVVEVRVVGSDLEGLDRLVFDRPGFSAEKLDAKDNRFQLTIAADVEPGTYDVWLSGRFGVSNGRLFAVDRGLKDLEDDGKNRAAETARAVEVGTAVNGTIDGNASDFFRLPLTKGRRVTIDCQAARLGSDLDCVLSLTTADGRILAASSDRYGADPCLDFLAPEDGDYLVILNDLSFRGGRPYRLTFSDRPHVEQVFPAAVQAGHPARLAALGQNLASLGGGASGLSDGGLPWDRLDFEFEPPADILGSGEYRFRDHPTHHSSAPTAATGTLVGLQVVPRGVEALWSFPPVVVVPDPVTVETEPNDRPEAAQRTALPLVLAARFDRPQDADWFEFQVGETGSYLFDVYCERIAGRADPYLVLVDDKGQRANELDDAGIRTAAFDGHLRDPSQEIALTKDRTYRVLVQDRYRRGGARYLYVLSVRKAEADFVAAVIHKSNQNPGGTTVFQGSATYLDVILNHRGAARSEVTVFGEDLPPGLHVARTTIPSNTRGTLVLWADEDAPDFTGPIRLVATAQHEGRTLRRTVRSHSKVSNAAGTSLVHRSQVVAVRERGPYGLRVEPEEAVTVAGKPVEAVVRLSRLWPDFRGKVSLQPLNFPGNIKTGNVEIGPDADSVKVTIDVPANTRPGRYTLAFLGQGQVPFAKDPAAATRPPTLVPVPSIPITVVVEAPMPAAK